MPEYGTFRGGKKPGAKSSLAATMPAISSSSPADKQLAASTRTLGGLGHIQVDDRAQNETQRLLQEAMALQTKGGGGAKEGTEVILNVYDLAPTINPMLEASGLPCVYHTGIQVGKVEYCFGGGAGIVTHAPRILPSGFDPTAKWCKAVTMGRADPSKIRSEIAVMNERYPGTAYTVVGKNCHYFCNDLCRRIFQTPTPQWVRGGAGGAAVAAVVAYAEARARTGKGDVEEVKILRDRSVVQAEVADAVEQMSPETLVQGADALSKLLQSAGTDSDAWLDLHTAAMELPESARVCAAKSSVLAEAALRAKPESVGKLGGIMEGVIAIASEGAQKALSPESKNAQKHANTIKGVWQLVAQMPHDLRTRMVTTVNLPPSVQPLCAGIADLSAEDCDKVGGKMERIPELMETGLVFKNPKSGNEEVVAALRSLLGAVQDMPASLVVPAAVLLRLPPSLGRLLAVTADVQEHLSDGDYRSLARAVMAVHAPPPPAAEDDGMLGKTGLGGLYPVLGWDILRREGLRPPPPEYTEAAHAVLQGQRRQIQKWFGARILSAAPEALVFVSGLLLFLSSVYKLFYSLFTLHLFTFLLTPVLLIFGVVFMALSVQESYLCRQTAAVVVTAVPSLESSHGQGYALLFLAVVITPLLWGYADLPCLLAVIALGLAGCIQLSVGWSAAAALDRVWSLTAAPDEAADLAAEAAEGSPDLSNAAVSRMLHCGPAVAAEAIIKVAARPGGQRIICPDDFSRWWGLRAEESIATAPAFEVRLPLDSRFRTAGVALLVAAVWGGLAAAWTFVMESRPEGLVTTAAAGCVGWCSYEVMNGHRSLSPAAYFPLTIALALVCLASWDPPAEATFFVITKVLGYARLLVASGLLCTGALGVKAMIDGEFEEEELSSPASLRSVQSVRAQAAHTTLPLDATARVNSMDSGLEFKSPLDSTTASLEVSKFPMTVQSLDATRATAFADTVTVSGLSESTVSRRVVGPLEAIKKEGVVTPMSPAVLSPLEHQVKPMSNQPPETTVPKALIDE
eukprot:Hpha_TRINITY_DN14506_c0_g2::TRINITY_DN14506_c0_g2_i1::g.47022::m.47022